MEHCLLEEESEDLKLRLELARCRIEKLCTEKGEPVYAPGFFYEQALFILMLLDLYDARKNADEDGERPGETPEWNRKLYAGIRGTQYEKSWADPAFACSMLGEENGKIFSALAAELGNLIVYVFEDQLFFLVITLELFLLFLSACEEETPPSAEELKKLLYSHFYDYCPEIFERRVSEMTEPEDNLIVRICMQADLSDPAYLYRYGEYITDNEIRTAGFLNSLTQDEIDGIAGVYTGGYRKGFEAAGKDLSKKKTVNIRFSAGFERIVRSAVKQFERMGLAPVIYRSPGGMLFRRAGRGGFHGASPNRQFDYDHRYDEMLILDPDLVSRKLSCLQAAFEDHKTAAAAHGGPAVIETFGERTFVPEQKAAAVFPGAKQMENRIAFESASAQIINRYIIGSERSFTIIAFPVPEIGERFPEIFREILAINGLDSAVYQKIQQKIIDRLDAAESVRIKGAGKNRTDLVVRLHRLSNPNTQTNFENCTADVNIPVGEVFTSPLLAGTDGILHVSYCYLNGLKFTDLCLKVKDGRISGYSCKGGEGDENGQKLIEDNILFGHKTLPMGEFAIGTNTHAYRAARKYGIEEKLPILIAEKTGPHFAFGDTCYSYEEDVRVFNPDGKEIVAKENECSAKRNIDPKEAYFNCHTDITLPYEELAFIRAVDAQGKEYSIIENGRYAVPGTEVLNVPLEEGDD